MINILFLQFRQQLVNGSCSCARPYFSLPTRDEQRLALPCSYELCGGANIAASEYSLQIRLLKEDQPSGINKQTEHEVVCLLKR